MKKKILAVLGAAVLVAGTMWATLAYFTDNAEVKNTFTVGKVKISLDETDIKDATGVTKTDENEYKMIPGREYKKDPTLTVEANSEDCYVYIVEEKAADTDDYINYTSGLTAINGWTSFVDSNGLTVYSKAVASSTTDTVIGGIIDGDKITIETTLDNDDMDAVTSGTAEVSIEYKAYAIQQEGFVDAEAAWNANFA